jgi:hypothetical protein
MANRHAALMWGALLVGCMRPALADSVAELDTISVDVTICSLVSEPQLYAGKTVRVPARYQTGGRHFSILLDTRCPSRGVVPDTENLPSDDPFLRAIGEGCRGAPDKEIVAVWVGKFHWEPQASPENGTVPRWLDVQKVDELSIKMIPGFPSCGDK